MRTAVRRVIQRAHFTHGQFCDRHVGAMLGGMYRRAARDIAAAAPRDGTVLDAGCGSGHLAAQIAPGRADLLAEAAGVMLGAAEGTVGEPRACAAAELCRAAGADPALVPQWTEEGRRRAQAVFDRQVARVARDAAGLEARSRACWSR